MLVVVLVVGIREVVWKVGCWYWKIGTLVVGRLVVVLEDWKVGCWKIGRLVMVLVVGIGRLEIWLLFWLLVLEDWNVDVGRLVVVLVVGRMVVLEGWLLVVVPARATAGGRQIYLKPSSLKCFVTL